MSDTISVPGYDTSNRVPGFYFAIDASKANTATIPRRVLLVGQKSKSGTATSGQSEQISGTSAAQERYGIGSQLALMVDSYRQFDNFGEIWALPLSDAKNAVAATGSLALTGTATESGKISLYVGGQLVEQIVNNKDSADTILSSLVNRINALATVPIQAAINNGTLTLTAINAGSCGNDLGLSLNWLGSVAGQRLPAGLTATLTDMANGNANPTDELSTGLASLGNRSFDLLIHPYTDAISLSLFTNFLDNQSGRWKITEQLFGHSITAFKGSFGQASALGETLNDEHMTIMATSDSLTPPMIWAAQIGAQVAISMRDNPAIPINNLTLNVIPPSDKGNLIFDQRNALLYDGISTFLVNNSNLVEIERLITTYRHNDLGLPDNSYLNIETMLTIAISLQDMKAYLASQFSRCILLQDNAKITAGQRATTAQLIAKSCASRYRAQANNLWVQDADGFAKAIIAQNLGNGLVKLLMPYHFSDQLFMIAGNCQFTKS